MDDHALIDHEHIVQNDDHAWLPTALNFDRALIESSVFHTNLGPGLLTTEISPG